MKRSFNRDEFVGSLDSRQKGARYERELARKFRSEGYVDIQVLGGSCDTSLFDEV